MCIFVDSRYTYIGIHTCINMYVYVDVLFSCVFRFFGIVGMLWRFRGFYLRGSSVWEPLVRDRKQG